MKSDKKKSCRTSRAKIEGTVPDNLLELHELRVFLVAAETENFSETGRILQISQPAVSGVIQSLEQRLQTQLFDRVGRNIKLNEMGEALVPLARRLLKDAEQLHEFVAQQRGTVVGQLLLGCSTAGGRYLLPKLMARFLARYPQAQIVCDVGPRGQALERLCEGKIDLAVSSLRVPRKAVEYRHFADDRLILIVPPAHPWAQRESLPPQELPDHAIVLREPSSGTTIAFNSALAQFEMSVEMLQVRLTLGSTESIVRAVIEGVGGGIVSQVAAEPALNQGQVVHVPLEGMTLVQHLYMARHKQFRASPLQTLFWDFAFAPENEDVRQLLT